MYAAAGEAPSHLASTWRQARLALAEGCCWVLLGHHQQPSGEELEQKQRGLSWVESGVASRQRLLLLPHACGAWSGGTCWALREEGRRLLGVQSVEGAA